MPNQSSEQLYEHEEDISNNIIGAERALLILGVRIKPV